MTNVLAPALLPGDRRSRGPGGGVSEVLDELTLNLRRENGLAAVRLGVLISAVGRRSYGPIFLLLGLFAISPATIVPGMTSLTALVVLLVAAQMAVGAKQPWLPKRVLDIRVPRRVLFVFLDRARPVIDRMEGDLIRPRATFLTVPLFVNAVGLCIVAAALITFPLSLVPLAPLAPGVAIVFFGLGMTARDGVWLAAGVALTLGAFALAAPLIL